MVKNQTHEDASDMVLQLNHTTNDSSYYCNLNIKLPTSEKESMILWQLVMVLLRWSTLTMKYGQSTFIGVSAAEIQAVEKERKAKNILLMAIPKEHMRRFHGMDDAKEIWEAIRTRFGGNANSKKMQKAVFKQQSLPPAWSNLAMTMRTNPEIDNLSIDDFKSSTNKVKSGFFGAYSSCTPFTSSTNVPEKEVLAGFADEV
ncbi:hypothetical protein Tco_1289818, partial [Tanacetum coccineum]